MCADVCTRDGLCAAGRFQDGCVGKLRRPSIAEEGSRHQAQGSRSGGGWVGVWGVCGGGHRQPQDDCCAGTLECCAAACTMLPTWSAALQQTALLSNETSMCCMLALHLWQCPVLGRYLPVQLPAADTCVACSAASISTRQSTFVTSIPGAYIWRCLLVLFTANAAVAKCS